MPYLTQSPARELDQSRFALWGQGGGPFPAYLVKHRVNQQVRVLLGEREGAGKGVAMAWVLTNSVCYILLEVIKS